MGSILFNLAWARVCVIKGLSLFLFFLFFLLLTFKNLTHIECVWSHASARSPALGIVFLIRRENFPFFVFSKSWNLEAYFIHNYRNGSCYSCWAQAKHIREEVISSQFKCKASYWMVILQWSWYFNCVLFVLNPLNVCWNVQFLGLWLIGPPIKKVGRSVVISVLDFVVVECEWMTNIPVSKNS